MKRVYLVLAVLTVCAAGCVPPLLLSDQPTAALTYQPTPRVHDVGRSPDLGPAHAWATKMKWEARHRFLLRKRFLETQQDLAEARAAAQERAWQLYESTTTTTQPYVPPTYVTPTTQPYVAPSYGYVDPNSLPWPWSCIVRVESGGYNAQNPYSSASGYFQFLDSTWTAVSGLPAPASAYSFAEQYAVAQSASLSNWTDGCT